MDYDCYSRRYLVAISSVTLSNNKRRLLFSSASMANSVDPDQTAPIGAVCSGSTLFVCILKLPVILGNYLQQTTSTDDIFSCIFLAALRAKS